MHSIVFYFRFTANGLSPLTMSEINTIIVSCYFYFLPLQLHVPLHEYIVNCHSNESGSTSLGYCHIVVSQCMR